MTPHGAPQPVDNSHFTEEQRTEAYRREHIALETRQAKALESMRGFMLLGLVLVLIGFIFAIFIIAANTRSGL